jgi:hypothetical protein
MCVSTEVDPGGVDWTTGDTPMNKISNEKTNRIIFLLEKDYTSGK